MSTAFAITVLLLAWALLARARKPVGQKIETQKIPHELRHPVRDWGRYDVPTCLRRRRNP